MTKQDRKRLRAAMKIHERLCERNDSQAVPHLPEDAWQDLVHAQRRVRLAEERGWRAAARAAERDYQRLAAAFSERLTDGIRLSPRDHFRSPVPSPREILADLAALEGEFAEVEFDFQEQTLSLSTDPIILDEIALGRFRIVLHWNELPDAGGYDVVAVDPHPAASDETATHPHVREDSLCEGDGRLPIRRALEQGRLLDFGLLVRQVLETYNPGSAYVPLSRWSGTACCDCGYLASDEDATNCDRCDADLCFDCAASCADCGRHGCSDCRDRCTSCEESHCTACLVSCADCDEPCCRQCLEQDRCRACREADENTGSDALITTSPTIESNTSYETF